MPKEANNLNHNFYCTKRYFLIWGEAPQDIISKERNPGVKEPINTLSRDMILLQI